jgi:hypothetical protein
MAENLIIEATKKTPSIIMEPGRIVIMGRSIPENPGDFYRRIYDWVTDYSSSELKKTNIVLGFEFINTTSIKWVYAILKELGKIPDLREKVRITWYYEEGDEDMSDLGFILRSLVDCTFQIIEVDDITKQGIVD